MMSHVCICISCRPMPGELLRNSPLKRTRALTVGQHTALRVLNEVQCVGTYSHKRSACVSRAYTYRQPKGLDSRSRTTFYAKTRQKCVKTRVFPLFYQKNANFCAFFLSFVPAPSTLFWLKIKKNARFSMFFPKKC